MALQVTNSPFSEEQVDLLNRLLPSITDVQQSWLSGYLTAISAAETSVAVLERPAETAVTAVKELTILYGSQTGNSQSIAEQAAAKFAAGNFDVTVQSMSDFKPNALKKIEHLLIIVSTHGEGDPPDTALPFYDFLHGRRAPKLDHLQYSVLALGDSSYEFFCKTGADFDEKLAELGAAALAPRVDCDLDYDEPAAQWLAAVEASLQIQNVVHTADTAPAAENSSAVQYSRTKPFRAEVLENINLNGRGSNKETRHIELSLEGSGLTYEPGDSVGIFPENNSELVDAIIKEGNWNAEETVKINTQGEQRAFRIALLNHLEITVLTKPLLQKLAEFTNSEKLQALIEPDNSEQLREYSNGRDLLDALQDFGPFTATEQQFASVLRKLPARLYSIASSISANPDEVHLTIGTVRYEAHGRERQGVCSIQCAERLEPGDTLPIYIHKNDNFRLPQDPNQAVIMIGPGTGVAPFRSFIEERSETGAEGKSWLFFGDQHYVTDFLYQTEWQNFVKDGSLTRLDTAFSRDTEEKIYVQHRMKQAAEELYKWIEEGAAIYVCGDEQYMAKDVHTALIEIIAEQGGKSAEQAEQLLTQLIQEKRYQRDVY